MRKFVRSVGAGLTGALLWLAALAPAIALTIPPTFAPRLFPWQLVHFERHVLQVNPSQSGFAVDNAFGCVFAAGSCSIKVGALPYNAFMLRGNWFQGVACNAVTSCSMSLGTSSGGTQLVSGQDIKTVVAGAPALTLVAASGQGAQSTGNGIAQTGTDLGFDLWVTVSFTGAAPTTGTIVFDLEYLAPDSGCSPLVPALGQTSPTC